MPHDFVHLAERIVEALLATDPALAAVAGDHRFDDRLPDLSADGVAAEVALLRDAATALTEIDTDLLDPPDRVDHAVLLALVERLIFERTEIRAHEWDPLAHNPGELLYSLIARPYAPVEQRLAAVASRLDALPDALATARVVLTDCPRIHLRTAVTQFAGVADLVRTEVPRLAAAVPALEPALGPLVRRVAAELDDFVAWLRSRLPDDDRDGRSPRLGRRLWEARLWYTLDSELSAREIAANAWAAVDEVTAQLREAAAELTGGPATDETVRDALARLAADHPTSQTIVDLAGRTLEEATAFVLEHDLVSLVDDPCVVMEMPEFARGVAVAYCNPPGPLETADVPTFYCIAPAPADWPAERVESLYREYNDHLIKNLTVHEAMPGHFLQLAHARRYRGCTRVRSLGWSGPFVEGWAVYAEELMISRGFGGLATRIQSLKMRLRMCINALLDQLVHCEGLPEAEAMALMTGVGFQEEGEAAGKLRRSMLTSTQLSTYFVGYTEVSAIAAARPAGASLRAWHDAMLAHGSPPPRHLRTLLGC